MDYFSIFLISIIFLYILFHVYKTRKPEIFYISTKENETILKKMKKLKEYYFPPILLTNQHLHTLFGTFVMRKSKNLKFEREILRDSLCGGTIAMDWIESKLEVSSDKPILIIYPGITGTSNSNYAQQTGLFFKNKNFSVICLNHRGMNCELTVSLFLF
jgi:predicted alpha/beta-fold hydrolase